MLYEDAAEMVEYISTPGVVAVAQQLEACFSHKNGNKSGIEKVLQIVGMDD
jgi:hypothetical protein